MARLPDPITDKLMVEWPDEIEWKRNNRTFSSILAEAVRKAESRAKKNEDGKEV